MGDLDAQLPVRVLQIVTQSGIAQPATDTSLSGNGVAATPLSVLGAPFAQGALYPRTQADKQGPAATTGTVTVPADAAAGDLLYLWVNYATSGAFNTPTGFTVLDAETATGGGSFDKTFTRVMLAGDTTFSLSTTSGNIWIAALIAIAKPGGTPAVDKHRLDSGSGSGTNSIVYAANTVIPTSTSAPTLFMWIACQHNGNAQTLAPQSSHSLPGGTGVPKLPISDPYGPYSAGGGPAIAFAYMATNTGAGPRAIFPVIGSAGNTPLVALANFI